MSSLKRFLAVALAVMMIFSITACRSKDDKAFIFKDGEQTFSISAANYIYHMISKSGEFQEEVANAQIEQYSTTSAGIDLDNETVTNAAGKNKGYDEFVKEETQQACAEFAYVEMQFEKNGLKLSKDYKTYLDNDIKTNWQQYAPYFEANGVYESSFKKIYKNNYKRQALYDFLYGEGGEKAPSNKELKKALKDNYVLAQTITVNFTDDEGNEMTKKEKKKAKAKLEGYLKSLKNGTMTFKEVYEDNTPNQTPSQTETKDPYSSPFGGEDTQFASPYYTKLNKMKQGNKNGKVLEFDDCYMLAVRTDIFSDDYYFDNLKEEMRSLLKNDEFNDFVAAEAAKLEVTKDDSVVNYYTPDRTKIPDEEDV